MYMLRSSNNRWVTPCFIAGDDLEVRELAESSLASHYPLWLTSLITVIQSCNYIDIDMDIYTDIDIYKPGLPLPALANQPDHGNSIIFVYRCRYRYIYRYRYI